MKKYIHIVNNWSIVVIIIVIIRKYLQQNLFFVFYPTLFNRVWMHLLHEIANITQRLTWISIDNKTLKFTQQYLNLYLRIHIYIWNSLRILIVGTYRQQNAFYMAILSSKRLLLELSLYFSKNCVLQPVLGIVSL